MGFVQDILIYSIVGYLLFGIVMVVFSGGFVMPTNGQTVIDLVLEILTGPLMLLKNKI